MRYRFHGLTRDTAEPVDGYVDAANEDQAYQRLGDRGILTSALQPAPASDAPASPDHDGAGPTLEINRHGEPEPDVAQALESAINTSSRTVHIDALAQQYPGQQVRMINREKIRRQIMQIIDKAIQQSAKHQESRQEVRDRIASAVETMFKDHRNLTQEAPAPTRQPGSDPLEQQIAGLSRVTQRMEQAVAKMESLLSSGDFGGGGGRVRFSHRQRERTEEQDAVLQEILQTNLELRRLIEEGTSGTRWTDSKTT